jgi:hypothetical protein
MSSYALSQVAVAFAVFLIGHVLIVAAGLSLPRSRSVSEFFWRIFWRYQPDIPRELIKKNHFAYLAIVIVAYCVVSVYRAHYPFPG